MAPLRMWSFWRELEKGVHTYRFGDLSLSHESDLPWPIVWAAQRCHPRHLVVRRGLPQLKPLLDSIVQFKRKVAWLVHYRNYAQFHPLRQRIRVPHRLLPLYPGILAPEVSGWLDKVRTTILSKPTQARASTSQGWYHNELGVPTAARRILAFRGLVLVPLDIGCGSVVITRDEFGKVHEAVLLGGSY